MCTFEHLLAKTKDCNSPNIIHWHISLHFWSSKDFGEGGKQTSINKNNLKEKKQKFKFKSISEMNDTQTFCTQKN